MDVARRFVVMAGFVCLGVACSGALVLAQEKTEPQGAQESASSVATEPAAPSAEPVSPAAEKIEAPVSEFKEGASSAVLQEGAASVPEAVPASAPAASSATAAAEVAAASAGKSSEGTAEERPSEWVWGEVVSVDETSKQIIVKHLDYETYEEVQMTIGIDEKTLYENVSGLGDIKAGDHVTVDYKAKEGGSVAGLVVVEKKEASSAETAAPAEGKKKEGVVSASPVAETAHQEAGPAAVTPAQDTQQASLPAQGGVSEPAPQEQAPQQEVPPAPAATAASAEKTP